MAEIKRHAGVDYKGEHNEYRPLPFEGTAKEKAESDAIIAKYANKNKSRNRKRSK